MSPTHHPCFMHALPQHAPVRLQYQYSPLQPAHQPQQYQPIFALQAYALHPAAPASYPAVPVTSHPQYPYNYSQHQFVPCQQHPPFVPPRMPDPLCFTGPSYALYSYQIPPSISQYVPEHQYMPEHTPEVGATSAMGPVPKVYPLSTAAWKDGNKLALKRDNWHEYSTKFGNQLGMIPGMVRFLEMMPGDPNVCTTAAEMWTMLCWRHLACGPVGQVAALKRFVSISYASDPKTFAAMTTLLTQCNEAIWQCGPLNPELFLLSGIIAALEANHSTMASTLLALPNLNLTTVLAALDIRGSSPGGTGGEVFVAASSAESCLNKLCPKPLMHTWPYCTSPGGRMDGKTILEAL